MKRIIFVRHGLTKWNEERRIQGHSDEGLSQNGIVQTLKTIDYIAGNKELLPQLIYSSDLTRTKILGEGLANKTGIPIIIAPELRETDYGSWSGKTLQEINAKDVFSAKDIIYSEKYGGEKQEEIMLRVEKIKKVIEERKEEKILIVSHGGFIRFLITYFTGIKSEYADIFMIQNCSISILEKQKDIYKIKLLNSLSHL